MGAVITLTDLVGPEFIIKILKRRILWGFLEMNRKALDLGMNLGMEFKN